MSGSPGVCKSWCGGIVKGDHNHHCYGLGPNDECYCTRACYDSRKPLAPAPSTTEPLKLPGADVWKWTCHRCGYWVESVELEDMLDCREAHRASCASPGSARRAAGEESDKGSIPSRAEDSPSNPAERRRT